MHATPPRMPSFEALDHVAVQHRIQTEMPEIVDEDRFYLSRAVMALIPPPSELGEYLRKAVADLDNICEFLRGSAAGNLGVSETLSDLVQEVFNMVRYLEGLRDRFQRRCQHETIEPSANGGKYCPGCGSGWGPGQIGDVKPGLVLTPRVYLPKDRKERDRPTGRAFFVYFITELLRWRGHRKTPALRAAGRLIAMFWNDGKPSYDDMQLDEAHRQGRDAGAQRGLATVEDFVHVAHFLDNDSQFLIWVPVKNATSPPSSA